LSWNIQTVKIVPLHQSFTHTISWANSYGPTKNYVSASHCQNGSNIELYELVPTDRPNKMGHVGGMAGFGKRQSRKKKRLRKKRKSCKH
jgi:hypothetical protein